MHVPELMVWISSFAASLTDKLSELFMVNKSKLMSASYQVHAPHASSTHDNFPTWSISSRILKPCCPAYVDLATSDGHAPIFGEL